MNKFLTIFPINRTFGLKLLIPAIFFLFSFTILPQKFTWTKLPVLTNKTITSICFLDSLYGFAVGDTGFGVKTTDGGLSWQTLQFPSIKDISDVFFVTRTTGYAVALDFAAPPFGTIFYKTTDGGDSWSESRYRHDDVFLIGLHFLDSLNGWASGLEGRIAHTTNGGEEWVPAQTDTSSFTNFPILGFSFYDDNYAFGFGGHIDIAGVIWKTTNSGKYWKAYGVGPEPIRGLIVFDSLNIIGIGGDFEYGTAVVTTTDGGENWDYRSLDVFGVPYGISFRNENEAWVPLGFAQKFIYTTDKGTNWVQYDVPDSGVLYDIQFTDSLTAYTAGRFGYIGKYSRSLVSVENEDLPTIPINSGLGVNYPNPFNPETIIPVKLAEPSHISLKVFDIRGRETTVLANGWYEEGEHQFTFKAENAASGIYIYRLDIIGSTGNKESVAKKMILNR